MSILGKGLKRIKEFSAGINSGRIDSLINETVKAEKEFLAEAKKLGIELANFNFKNYYEILGIKYTNDSKAIKATYVKLVKEYHPDISSDVMATQKMEELNEAYGVLKDKEKKADYDAKFSKGRNRMSSDVTKTLYNEFMRRYQEIRNKDFEDFNKRVANPQDINSIRATIEETVNWTRRFRQISNNIFGTFRDYGVRLKHLESRNRSMLRGEKSVQNLNLLNSNLAKLDGLVKAFDEADKGIDGVVSSVMDDVATQENNIADRLRRSVN